MHMFGLKIIKKQEYLNLQKKVDELQKRVVEQNATICALEQDYNKVSTQLHQLQNPTSDNGEAVLLTDVAVQPLEVVKKTRAKKTTRSKTTKSTTRKRTRKAENAE